MRPKLLDKVTKYARILKDFWITSLAYVKYQVKIFLGVIFFYELIFNFFVAVFMQKDDNIIFVCGCYRTR